MNWARFTPRYLRFFYGVSMNKNEELLPYYKDAKKWFRYDYNSGLFYRKVNRGKYKKDSLVKCAKNNGYNYITVNGRIMASHRIAWFIYYDELPNVIDHIDRDRSNNKISNLRDCTQRENSKNSVKYKGVSGIKYVTRCKRDSKWMVMIRGSDGKKKFFGRFHDVNKAEEVAKKEAFKISKEFTNLKTKTRK